MYYGPPVISLKANITCGRCRYLEAKKDRVTVVFSTVFKDDDDVIIGKVFMQVCVRPHLLIFYYRACLCLALFPLVQSSFSISTYMDRLATIQLGWTSREEYACMA